MDIRAIGMGVAFAFMWASAFTSARIIVMDMPPLTALAVRFLISGLIGAGLALAMGQTWRLTRIQWALTAVFGICQNAIYLGLNFVAMQWIEASLAAIIAAAMPLLMAFAGRVFLSECIRPLGAAGLVVGLAGVMLIMGTRFGGGADPAGVALCVIGVLALTTATLVMRGATSGGNVMMIVGLQMLVGSAALAPFALMLEPWQVTYTWRLVLAFLYTTLIPGLAATWVWFRLVNRIGMIRASTFHFLSPVFGVTVAAVLLQEAVGLLDALGVIIVTLGILAVQLARQDAR